jgi:hypothetical protein
MARERAKPSLQLAALFVACVALEITLPECAAKGERMEFEVSFPASASAQPITGRVFVILSRSKEPEPRLQAGNLVRVPLLFGVDVDQLSHDQPAVVDAGTLGFPQKSLREIPAGDYYLQGVLNVYTEFHRADGHVIWAHMDQWEGQQFNTSPGNLYSEVRQERLDPQTGYDVKLSLTKVIPPVEVPPDTDWLKHIKIPSKLLTRFWGHPIYLGATVLLPKGYDSYTDVHYPMVYLQDHFNLGPPFPFQPAEPPQKGQAGRQGLGYEFYRAWNADNFPRMIAVRFQHPTPYFDDSYVVNSANNGPYGDAIITELIPYIEEHFRTIRKSYARLLWGGSTGGWESLALQVYHPDFFGGTWTFFPDPIDFRRYGMVNIYEDENAFTEDSFEIFGSKVQHEWIRPERPLMRSAEGQVELTARQFSRLEEVLGTRGRSGQQLEAWEAVYGPVGNDGYPKPLWDKLSGKIDHEVANYMRDHGYDLRYYIETNWPKIGPQLVGKLHLYCGEMDNFYLNLAVYKLEDFLKNSKDPYYAGSFEYGRPMKGHGWMPMSFIELVRMMADHVTKNAPGGENPAAWKYN